MFHGTKYIKHFEEKEERDVFVSNRCNPIFDHQAGVALSVLCLGTADKRIDLCSKTVLICF